ncbi:MAG: hypothetical protein EOO38_24865 [Cytophagaceae bacterium]|nr:MAG: hypothetical protein EOO38_24865 [Cytophagaceae bacterium]
MPIFSDAILAIQREHNPKGSFAETLRPELVEEALVATGTASTRKRKLPADQVVWLMVGFSLFQNQSLQHSCSSLGLAIDGKPVSSSVSDARKRLGPAPMEYLFRKVGEAWTASHEKLL